MKSNVYTFGKTAEAYTEGSYQYVQELRSKYQINGEGKEYSKQDMRCIRECIDRLLPRKKKK